MQIRQTPEFARWLGSVGDPTTRARLAARIQRLASGNFGDASPVGEGVSELRLHFGPGYRVYFIRRGDVLVILFCGGDKATQRIDIERAKRLAQQLKDR